MERDIYRKGYLLSFIARKKVMVVLTENSGTNAWYYNGNNGNMNNNNKYNNNSVRAVSEFKRYITV